MSAALTLEVDDDLDVVSGSEESSADQSDVDGSASSDEESEDDGEYFCDRCENRRETPGVARSSPRPIVGVRYHQRNGDEDLCAACYASLTREEQRGYDAINDNDDTTSESDGPPRLSPTSRRGVRRSLAQEEDDEDELPEEKLASVCLSCGCVSV